MLYPVSSILTSNLQRRKAEARLESEILKTSNPHHPLIPELFLSCMSLVPFRAKCFAVMTSSSNGVTATYHTLTALNRWSIAAKTLPAIDSIKSLHIYDFDNTRQFLLLYLLYCGRLG